MSSDGKAAALAIRPPPSTGLRVLNPGSVLQDGKSNERAETLRQLLEKSHAARTQVDSL